MSDLHAYTSYVTGFPQAARKMAAECPALRVRKASRVLARLYDEALAPFGLQSSQLSVLAAAALFGDAGATMSRLAQALLMDRTTLSRSIRPLERAALVRVARAPEDARTKIVVITRAGERLIESIFPVWERVLGQVRTSLGVDTLAELHSRLDRVIALSADPKVARARAGGRGRTR